MKKLLYFFPVNTSFVAADYKILSKKYEVSSFYFKPFPKWHTPYYFFSQFLFIIFRLHRTGIMFSQFSGYHSFLPALFSRLFNVSHFIVLNGTECNNFPEIKYGYLARVHFEDVYRTIRAFEYWFGPYPFYEDGYKLVEVPYLGMEHQSSVTYGNKFLMGYLGKDLSATGWGLKWDFIIVHESAHEWWANNITYKDMADMWIHESFANYAESLFLDYHFGSLAANEYVIGTRLKIQNDKPIIGPYNVNREGSHDMYYKGGNMLHSLRTWLNDDVLWRKILRGLQQEFYHQTVTTAQIENYMSLHTGKDLNAFFNQYLRDTRIPVVEFQIMDRTIKYRYTNIVNGFNMPLKVMCDKGESFWIEPTNQWKEIKQETPVQSFSVDPNFYVKVRDVSE